MIGIPELRGHKDFGARNPALTNGLSDRGFVAVDLSRVYESVARFQGIAHRVPGHFTRRVAEDAQPDGGDFNAVVEGKGTVNRSFQHAITIKTVAWLMRISILLLQVK